MIRKFNISSIVIISFALLINLAYFFNLASAVRISKHLVLVGSSLPFVLLLSHTIITKWKEINFNISDLFPILFFFYAYNRVPNNQAWMDEKFYWLPSMLFVYFYLLIQVKLNAKLVAQLVNALLFTALLQSLLALLQLYHVIPSHFPKHITGTFFNPALLGAYLACLLPYAIINTKWISFPTNKKRVKLWLKLVFYPLTAFLILATLPSTMSRAAWLASGISIIILYSLNTKKTNRLKKSFLKKHLKKTIILLTIIVVFTTIGLYHLKKDSANGRLLTWKICAQMIAEKPIFGHGFNRLEADILNYQSEYFSSNKGSEKEKRIAGNIHWAFNEFIQLTVELGIIGLLLFLGWIISSLLNIKIANLNRTQKGAFASLSSLLVFSLFSYPLYSPLLFLLFVTSLAILSGSSRVKRYSQVIKPTILVAVAGLGLISLYYASKLPLKYKAYKNWNSAISLYKADEYKEANNKFNEAFPIQQNNGKFLVNYAKSLHLNNCYKQADTIYKEALQYWSDDILYTSIADNYRSLAKFDKAEQFYKKASFVIPHKMYPQYRLTLMYLEIGDTIAARKIAIEILSKPIKIQSTAVNQIRKEMQTISKMHNYEN